ncbi:MAG: hypothetical protein IT229_11345, partial [Flavobacteriales bacterium]|nr:hypothetical protein [Flavobacteriales bacterium]
MRVLLLFATICGALHVDAQLCEAFECPFPPTTHPQWLESAVTPSGSVVGIIEQDDQQTDVVLAKMAPDGTVQWTKRYAATNPLIELLPVHVVASPAGGGLVVGNTVMRPSAGVWGYQHYFGIRFNDAGEVLWARYFMHQAPRVGDTQTFRVAAAAMDNDEFVIGTARLDGLNLTRLDSQGQPTWSKHYEIGTPSDAGNTVHGLSTDATGRILVAGMADSEPFAMRTDASGTVEWARQYSMGGGCGMTIVPLSGGGYLWGGSDYDADWLYGNGVAMNINDDGSCAWVRRYAGMWGITNAVQLPSGDLFIATRENALFVGQKITTSGATFDSWSYQPAATSYQLAGNVGDSLYFTTQFGTWNNMQPMVILAGSSNDLSCGFTQSALNSVSLALPPTSDPLLTVVNDVLKTWTMSLGPVLNQNSTDLSVIGSSTAARPGFDTWVAGTATNHGGLSGGLIDVSMVLAPEVSYVSANPNPTQVNGNTLQWLGMPAVGTFDLTNFVVRAVVPANTPLGTVLSHTITVAQDSAEVTQTNNAYTFTRTVTGSYDPNDKLVVPEDYFRLNEDSTLT